MGNFEKPHASKELAKRITSHDFATIENNYAKFAQLEKPILLNTVSEIESGFRWGNWKSLSIIYLSHSIIAGGIFSLLPMTPTPSDQIGVVIAGALFGAFGMFFTEAIAECMLDKSIIGFLTTRIINRQKYKKLALVEAQKNRNEIEKYNALKAKKEIELPKIEEEARLIVEKYNTSGQDALKIKFEKGAFEIEAAQESLFSHMAEVVTGKELSNSSGNLAIAE